MYKLGVVMDSIQSIKVHKDSTFAMLLEAQARGWTIHYMEQKDLWAEQGRAYANSRLLRVKDDPNEWFDYEEKKPLPLGELEVILMRKDPPFDMEYIYTTYLLELAERTGTTVVNRPQALRDANEKLFITHFPECCTPTLVTRAAQSLRQFHAKHQDIILKPLDGMGGAGIFRLRAADTNLNVVIETLTAQGTRFIMAQRYIPEISEGDKRILLIDGEPVPYALARIPAPGDNRGNLAAGAKAVGVPLSPRDRWICQQVGPTLRAMGLIFVGIDVIGDYLTEINVTSPTCIRELDQLYSLNISAQLLDALTP